MSVFRPFSSAVRFGVTGALFACVAACGTSDTADSEEPTSSEDQIVAGDTATCHHLLINYKFSHRNSPPLKIVTEGAFEPFNFVRDGKLVGWEVDHVAEVMKTIGRDYTLEARAWDGCCERQAADPNQGVPPANAPGKLFSDIFAGRVDLGFAAISNGAVRKSVFPFSNRYGFTNASKQFQYRADRAPSLNLSGGLSVLDGKRVAVQQGTNHYFYVTGQLVANQHHTITVQPYPTSHDAAVAVRDGLADYVFGFESEETTKELIANGTFVSDKTINSLDPTGLANVWGQGATYMFRPSIANDEQGLVEAVNCAIEKLTNRRIVDRLNKKWAGNTGPSFVYCSPDETDAQCDARD